MLVVTLCLAQEIKRQGALVTPGVRCTGGQDLGGLSQDRHSS